MKKIKIIAGALFLLPLIFISCTKSHFSEILTTEAVYEPRIYYVSDATGADTNDGLSQAKPFKTLGKAAPYALPGDIVYLLTGTYNVGATISINNSGTKDKYITFAALPNNKPKLVITGNIFNGITINGSYIKFDGIELQGNNANLTYAGAYAAYQTLVATGATNGTYNTNALVIGGPFKDTKFPHHIEVRNCAIHDFPGGGLIAIQADYLTFENNTVYNNAWYSNYAPSGISILNPFNSDNVTTYKNIVRNNVCYGNKTMIPWSGITPARLSDGNGIIMDTNIRPYGAPATATGPGYNGRTLVENNISFNNGGSGIHAFEAAHVDIINNTAFNNGVVMGYADIYAGYSNDVKIMNNIMYSQVGGKSNTNTLNTNVTYDFNIYFRGTVAVMGPNDIVADPQLINVSTDPLVANFQLKSSSPAVNSGTTSLFAGKDFLGVQRPKGAGPDRGAYESF